MAAYGIMADRRASQKPGPTSRDLEVLEILAGAVCRRLEAERQIRDRPFSRAEDATDGVVRVPAAPSPPALLSPRLRASMSAARGAQKPPAKEDEHG